MNLNIRQYIRLLETCTFLFIVENIILLFLLGL